MRLLRRTLRPSSVPSANLSSASTSRRTDFIVDVLTTPEQRNASRLLCRGDAAIRQGAWQHTPGCIWPRRAAPLSGRCQGHLRARTLVLFCFSLILHASRGSGSVSGTIPQEEKMISARRLRVRLRLLFCSDSCQRALQTECCPGWKLCFASDVRRECAV